MTDVDRCGGALWVSATVNKQIYSRCIRCGRTLKSEEAQERGYGKICWKKHLSDKQRTLL